jgi:glycosyl hydrolase family 16
LLIGGQASNNYAAAGIEQAPTGASAGEGYGLYQFTGAAAIAGQGNGICFVLWRSDNVWLDSKSPGELTELDILESWDGTRTGQATDHYYNAASDQNGQVFHTISGIDLTRDHIYAMDWEKNSLTYYVDGEELYQITGSTVPKDTADGGCNYTMGAEVVNETGPVGLYIKDMRYSAPISSTTAAPAPVVSSPVVAVTLSGGNQVYTADDKTDSVTATGTASTVTGGSSSTSSVTLVQNGGSYDFANKAGSATIVANSAPGTITGGAAGSRLVAFLNDQPTTYIGNLGNDELIGGSGNMTVNAGSGGSLVVFGGTGTLQFQGGRNDAETVVGGAGAETIHAAASGGAYFGGSGGSQMFATGTGTLLVGAVNGDVLTSSTTGGDMLVAGAGNETLNGSASAGVNVLYGGTGGDSVMLGAGNDSFIGGAGTATIQMGSGSAAIFAGAGAMLLSFDALDIAARAGQPGSDIVVGFRIGTDHLALSGSFSVMQDGSNAGMTSLTLSDGTQVHLAGVSGAAQASLFG